MVSIITNIAATKSYKFIRDKSFPKNKQYQILNAYTNEIIASFPTKHIARLFFIEKVKESPERDILKFMGIEFQI